MKRRWRILIVLTLLPVLLVSWLLLTDSGLNRVFQLTQSALPEGLIIDRIEGRLIGPITLRGVSYQQPDIQLKAKQLIVDWHPGALFFATIDIQKLHIQSLQINLPAPTAAVDPAAAQQPLLPDVQLPWRMVLQDLQIDELNILQDGHNLQLQQLRLTASSLFNQIHIQQFALRGDNFSVEVQGKLQPSANYPHQLDLAWSYTLPTGAVIQGSGELAGNLQQTHLTQQLTGPLALTLSADAQDLAAKINWQATVDVSAFDTKKISADWPVANGQLQLKGKGDLDSAAIAITGRGQSVDAGAFNASVQARINDQGVKIEQLALQLPGNKTRLAGHGHWTPGDAGGKLKLTLNWNNLRWPMQGTPWFDSASGHGDIDGTRDHYRINLATESPWPEAAPSYWKATAEGDLNGMTFHDLRIQALDGEALVTGRLDWSPALSWTAQAQLHDVNPAGRWPDWPGKLNATLQSRGRTRNEQLVADVDIDAMTGLLRGYPVTLRSKMTWRDDVMDIAALEFQSAASHISAQGKVGESLDLRWRIEAANLAELYPQLHGELRASGALSGKPTAPLIKASFSGRDLAVPDYRIGRIEGDVALDLLQWQQIDMRVAAQQLELNGYAIQAVEITADTQRLQAQISADVASLTLALQGERDASGWHGQIVRADVRSSQFDDWQLQSPALLAVGENTLRLENLCWQNAQQASVCGRVQREQSLWQSVFQLKQIPLRLLSAWLPDDLILEGVADADANLQFQEPDQLRGTAHIQLPPGEVSYVLVEGDRNRWRYDSGAAELSLAESGVTASSALELGNGDLLQLAASLPGAQLLTLNPARQSLSATAQLAMRDLGLIEALLPEIQDFKGTVAASLAVSGTLAQPQINGQATLQNGAFRLPRLGLNIEQVSLQAQNDGPDTIRYTLGARSGDGRLAVQGQTLVDHAAGWSTELGIKGQQFEVARIPDARVQVSPDLKLKIHNRNIDLSGQVEVPFARLQPKDITTAARVTDDAVIVGGEQQAESKWLMRSKVRLTLGDRVSLYGFGFEGRLGGSLLLEDEPGQLTKATGEINVPEGRYRAYGQRLEVDRGRLIFAGGPVINPGLDLRAVRQINTITAGVRVKGTLAEPHLELFSNPAMGETDMLSYLILGRPMETASGEEGEMMAKAALAVGLSGGDKVARVVGDRIGLDEMHIESSEQGNQASLVVGRYLSPKVYVSYGVGLIESINTFTVRYQISDHWHIKAESGESQGADIFYTIDR